MGGFHATKRKGNGLLSGAKVKLRLPSELPLELVPATDFKMLSTTELFFGIVTFPIATNLLTNYLNSPHPAYLWSSMAFFAMSVGLVIVNIRTRIKISSGRVVATVPLDAFETDNPLVEEKQEKILPTKVMSAELLEDREVRQGGDVLKL